MKARKESKMTRKVHSQRARKAAVPLTKRSKAGRTALILSDSFRRMMPPTLGNANRQVSAPGLLFDWLSRGQWPNLLRKTKTENK